MHTKTHPSARQGRAGVPEGDAEAEDPAEELLSALAAEALDEDSEDDERGGDSETSDAE